MDTKIRPLIYSVYKRHTSNLGTHTNWKWGAGNGDQKKVGIVIPMSDKIDFKIKTIIRHTLETTYNRYIIRGKLKRHCIVIKWSMPQNRYKNYKYICPT